MVLYLLEKKYFFDFLIEGGVFNREEAFKTNIKNNILE